MYYVVYFINLLITRFLRFFRRFPKIFKMVSSGHTNVSEHFPNFSGRLPKIDFSSFSIETGKLVSKRDEIDIFTCEDMIFLSKRNPGNPGNSL